MEIVQEMPAIALGQRIMANHLTFLELWSAFLGIASGALCILTYLNPEANAVTRFIDNMLEATFEPKALMSHRTYCLISGAVCLIVGLVFFADAVGIIRIPRR
jgi:hypothetical protein